LTPPFAITPYVTIIVDYQKLMQNRFILLKLCSVIYFEPQHFAAASNYMVRWDGKSEKSQNDDFVIKNGVKQILTKTRHLH